MDAQKATPEERAKNFIEWACDGDERVIGTAFPKLLLSSLTDAFKIAEEAAFRRGLDEARRTFLGITDETLYRKLTNTRIYFDSLLLRVERRTLGLPGGKNIKLNDKQRDTALRLAGQLGAIGDVIKGLEDMVKAYDHSFIDDIV